MSSHNIDYEQVSQTDKKPEKEIEKEIKKTRKSPKKPLTFKFPDNFFYFIVPCNIIVNVLGLYYIMTTALSYEKEGYTLHGLEEGWFGFRRDCSDGQWRALAGGLLEIFIGAAIFLGVSHQIKQKSEKQNIFNNLVKFNIVFGLGFVTFLFHIGIIYWFLEVLFCYLLIKYLNNYKFFPILIWAVCVLLLFVNEGLNGFGFTWINDDESSIWYTLERDMHDGSEVRWHVMFNLSILKIISFGMDQYWAKRKTPRGQKPELKDSLSYKARQENHIPLSNYTFTNFMSFMLYTPLFIAGPITTFNAYVSHLKTPQTTFTFQEIKKYLFRTLLNLFLFECFIHVNWSFALLTDHKNEWLYQRAPLSLLGIMGYMTLQFIYFKFLCLWRLFRCWALLDGVETPENMNRCICDNTGFEGFWRAWHRSFNQWLVRYVFIPCGGTKYKFLNVWVVFTFVALWHDLNISLLLWAWCICLSMIIEIGIKSFFAQSKFDAIWTQGKMKFICFVGMSVLNLMMLWANLIGFGNGKDGVFTMMSRIFSFTYEGITFWFQSVSFMMPISILMYAVRDYEQKTGKEQAV